MFLSIPVANLPQIHFPYSIAPALAAAEFTYPRLTSLVRVCNADQNWSSRSAWLDAALWPGDGEEHAVSPVTARANSTAGTVRWVVTHAFRLP
jgi:hypothetical protein